MCCRVMCKRVLPTIFILIALALAVAVTFLHQNTFATVVNVSHFFDVMIPVLAVGALIKYLSCHGHCCHHHKPGESCSICGHKEENK